MAWYKQRQRHSIAAQKGWANRNKIPKQRIAKQKTLVKGKLISDSPYIRLDGSYLRIKYDENDGLYHLVRAFRDKSELWSRKGYKKLVDADKKRDDVVEEDNYWDEKQKIDELK